MSVFGVDASGYAAGCEEVAASRLTEVTDTPSRQGQQPALQILQAGSYGYSTRSSPCPTRSWCRRSRCNAE